ncbi:hypothetical protein AeMF1_021363, partial [Aphanomyces euteiches]
MTKKSSTAAPSALGEQTSHEESLNPPAIDTSQANASQPDDMTSEAPLDPFASLKAMIEAQYEEIKLLRNQSLEANKNQPPRSTESEAKDLLRKVKFNGKHFSSFKIKFQNICQLRHIWEIVQGTETLPINASESQTLEFQDKVDLAKSYLQTSLSNEVFEMIREDETPAEMWKILIANYETKEWSNTIYNRHAKTHHQCRSTIRELNDMGKTITEQETVEWILITLPDSCPDNFNAFINHLKPTPQQEVKLKTLISALLNEEEKRGERARMRRTDRQKTMDFKRHKTDAPTNATNEINAIQARTQPKRSTSLDDKWCFICRKRGNHVAQDHPDFDPNHGKSAQRPRQPPQTTRSKRRKESSELSDSPSDDEATYNINCITGIDKPSTKETHWTLDNCATGHVTGQVGVISTWHGSANLILPNQTKILGQVGQVKLRLCKNGESSTLILHDVTAMDDPSGDCTGIRWTMEFTNDVDQYYTPTRLHYHARAKIIRAKSGEVWTTTKESYNSP